MADELGKYDLMTADELQDALLKRDEELARVTKVKDGAYSERNKLVAAISKMFPASLERHDGADWEDEWRWVVFIDLPTGQASWHLHDSELPQFDHLPRMTGRKWDGHTNDEKYARLQEANAELVKLTAELRDHLGSSDKQLYARAEKAEAELLRMTKEKERWEHLSERAWAKADSMVLEMLSQSQELVRLRSESAAKEAVLRAAPLPIREMTLTDDEWHDRYDLWRNGVEYNRVLSALPSPTKSQEAEHG